MPSTRSLHPHQLDLPKKKSKKLKNIHDDHPNTILDDPSKKPSQRRMQTLPLPGYPVVSPSPHTSYRLAAAMPTSPSFAISPLPSENPPSTCISPEASDTLLPDTSSLEPIRRVRSRAPTRLGHVVEPLPAWSGRRTVMSGLRIDVAGVSGNWRKDRRGENREGIVMTPTTEEWRAFSESLRSILPQEPTPAPPSNPPRSHSISISSTLTSDSSSSSESSDSLPDSDEIEDKVLLGDSHESSQSTIQRDQSKSHIEQNLHSQASVLSSLGKATEIGQNFPAQFSGSDALRAFALTDRSKFYHDEDDVPPSPASKSRHFEPESIPPSRPSTLTSLSAASLTSSKQLDPRSVFLSRGSTPSNDSMPERKGIHLPGVGFSPSVTPVVISRTSSTLPLPDRHIPRIPLIDSRKPIDAQMYSAITGARNIDCFIMEGEAGKGAYGLVRRAREKGPDGEPTGPLTIIKYIIKQRILADCWKRHKTLGPIPVEIHVLDYIRRAPYTPPPTLQTRVPQRKASYTLPLSTVGADTVTGHPSICPMLDFFEDPDYYYLVMPLSASCRDLFDYVDSYPDGLPVQEIKNIFYQVSDAVRWLHSIGIVHRDIKDENVVLDGENGMGGVKLIDFGSAAYVREGKKFDTFSGTLDFASPEVLKGERYSGKETDVWALGVLLYVLIVGECPFYAAEEVQEGVQKGTRGQLALTSKIPEGETVSSGSPSPLLSPKTGLPEVNPGSGRIADAVDLCSSCLDVNSSDRPSAEDIMLHAFFRGSEGWRGHLGWNKLPPRPETSTS